MDATTKNSARKRSVADNPPSLKITPANDADLEHSQTTPADLRELAQLWPTLQPAGQAAILATARALAGIAAQAEDLPALSRPAAIVFDEMLKRPEHHAMTRAEMLDLLADHRENMSAATLGARVIPQLLARGAVNTPRRGYSIPRRLRLCA